MTPRPASAKLRAATARSAIADADGLMGAAEACAALGVLSPNLYKVAGLPTPVAEPASGKVWLGCEIHDLAERRSAARAEREAAATRGAA